MILVFDAKIQWFRITLRLKTVFQSFRKYNLICVILKKSKHLKKINVWKALYETSGAPEWWLGTTA